MKLLGSLDQGEEMKTHLPGCNLSVLAKW